MNYFEAKSNLEFIIRFHNDVLNLWEKEDAASKAVKTKKPWMGQLTPTDLQPLVQEEASKQSENYQDIRKSVVCGLSRMQTILMLLDETETQLAFYSPQAVGGPGTRLGVFEAIVRDTTYGDVNRQMVIDALNQVTGACEVQKERALRDLVNPLCWLKKLVFTILRLPFILIEATGFNVSKFEDQFFGKFFKLLVLLGLLSLGSDKTDLVEILIRRD